MWRNKNADLATIKSFIEDLKTFKRLKEQKWEKIDEAVQQAIRPGTPSEDWIIPPDENLTLKKLENDPEYVKLRARIESNKTKIKSIGRYIRYNVHHDFDWILFINPLIGNDALEDGIEMSENLYKACETKNYFLAPFF